jgi:hypothetical protein
MDTHLGRQFDITIHTVMTTFEYNRFHLGILPSIFLVWCYGSATAVEWGVCPVSCTTWSTIRRVICGIHSANFAIDLK